MSRQSAVYGPLNQVSYIVPDLGAAIEYWTRTMQVGPFFVFPPFEIEQSDYRGQPLIVQFGAAIAYSGDLMVELIEPRGPSIFQEQLEKGNRGVHHLASFADDMASAQQEIEARGGKRLQGASFVGGSEVAYFAMTPDESITLEIAVLAPAAHGLFAAIKAAGAVWDGTQQTITF